MDAAELLQIQSELHSGKGSADVESASALLQSRTRMSDMIIVNAGFGKHDVIEGRVVSKGLTKKDALALAGMPAEKAKGESAKAPEMPAEPVADKKTNEAA